LSKSRVVRSHDTAIILTTSKTLSNSASKPNH
jgi:hypothetical protein